MKTKFFDICVKPFKDVYTECKEKEWKLDKDIEVKSVLITISTWDLVPVKVGVCLDGAGVDAGSDGKENVLACLTTPATGGGSSSIYAHSIDKEIEKERKINIYVWAHNMREKPVDFHSQVIIYYKT